MAAAKVAGACSLIMFFGENFTLEPMKGYSWWQAGLAEALYTFMLCFVFLNTSASKADEGNHYFGLAVGFVVAAGIDFAGGFNLHNVGCCFAHLPEVKNSCVFVLPDDLKTD